MTVHYMVLAHQSTTHLTALVDALSGYGGKVTVHIDGNSNLGDFERLPEGAAFTENRVPVRWGSFSMVEATLILMRETLNFATNSDRLILLSGADFPIVSPEYLIEFFKESATAEFINLTPLPSPGVDKPLSRISALSLPYNPRDGKLHAGKRAFNALKLPRPYRKALGERTPYAGSQWWALSAKASRYILKQHKENPKLAALFRSSMIPDESYFQTLLGNSPFRQNVRPNLTFTDWTRPSGPRPATIDNDHLNEWSELPALEANNGYGKSPFAFARKFPGESTALLNRVQKEFWTRSSELLPATSPTAL